MTPADSPRRRISIVVRGAVQGVGFRPFVYRLAKDLALPGWVRNTSQGVFVELEGPSRLLQAFLDRLELERPPRSSIQSLEHRFLDLAGFKEFKILESTGGAKTALIQPDIATCSDCLSEIFDLTDRRFRYPFTNCTNCGPRFSIVEGLPYDRPKTSMKGFEMCGECAQEYNDPENRRFHAQPNACPICGPQLAFTDSNGRATHQGEAALASTVRAILDGAIVAIKGLGGFHLLVGAWNEQAVRRLRERKCREEKPLAVMLPGLHSAERLCRVSEAERRLLRSPEAPIVLLARSEDPGEVRLAESVAPGNPYLGVMLPYTPLHHLILHEIGRPVVATSGNVSDEPICIGNREALERLAGIADFFLLHNRPIVRHIDDSVVRVLLDRELVLRRSRGYAPLPLRLRQSLPPLLAVGAHLKSTVAISVGQDVFLSQHIGDLETREALDAFQAVSEDLCSMYEVTPEQVICDAHPDYLSTHYALKKVDTPLRVQHHYAHILACMAENELEPPVLGVSWDGTGFGTDGTVWGGEFLVVGTQGYRRAAHFRTFPLPGGEAVMRQPRRSALGLLFELLGDQLWELSLPTLEAFDTRELAVLRRLLETGHNCPRTSSAGRIFDAVASICGLRQRASFEGQAAAEVESSADMDRAGASYEFALLQAGSDEAAAVIDWGPMIRGILDDQKASRTVAEIMGKFHQTLCEMVVVVARSTGEVRVCLSGGCFQNRHLVEKGVRRLTEEGFRAYWHQRVPPNDGGIALGQIMAACRRRED